MTRFAEFLQVLQPIVDGEPATRTSLTTDHYRADEAPSTPGALQRPLPLTIAAGAPKGMRLAARHGRNWVTVGPTGPGPRTPEALLEAVQRQVPQLEEACRAEGRHPSDIGRVVLFTPTEPLITTIDQFDDLAGPYVELGFDQFVIHHPAQTGPYGGDVNVFEQIAARNYV
jgi:alkanesulfonate monooxygenase SsuD/methylene tetrahydromethanopterin reductase-like flavin-dependent oxidoreductase (luciferase family)